jgi:formyl-CoA transferase
MALEVSASSQVLDGIRVLELGQLIAGPFCGKTLADFGADVVKIEPPGSGDPLRKWRLLKEGTSVWWQVQSRNKRSVTLDLRSAEGQDVARALIVESDVLIENFKPGTMENWGLGWERVSAINPGLIMLRVSGYGQDGPYRNRPGFAAIAEAMGGLRYITGEPGRTPVRTGVSIGDTLAALHGTIGVLLALYHRKVNGGVGQVIDVALYESVFNCMESLLPDSNDGRVQRVAEIDSAIATWTAKRSVETVLSELARVEVPAGRIYTAKDISSDTHYRARGMIERVKTRDGYEIDVPGIVPKLSATPGSIRHAAPRLGEDTFDVLKTFGYSAEQIAALSSKKVI